MAVDGDVPRGANRPDPDMSPHRTDTGRMRLRTLLRPLLAPVLLLGLVACGDDDAPSTETLTGEADGPVVRITVDDPGWSVATPGFDPSTGDIPVQLLNERDAEVDVWVFLAPEGYEPDDAIPDGVDPVVEETLAAGADVQDTALMNEPGDYAVLVEPLTVGSAERIGQGITVVDG